MSEEQDTRTERADGWPLPSPDVQRELEPPELAWAEPEWPLSQQLRRSARA